MKTHTILLALAATSMILTNEGRAQGSLTPSGAPAATMRSLDQIEPRLPISSLPFAISQPGSYYLTRNLAGTQEGLSVACSGVTIDLNGFELVGNRLVVGHGITVATGCANVTIRNGTVRSWGGDGVHASTALYVAVDDLWVEDCAGYGIAMSSGSIGHITSQGNGSGGLFQSNPIPGIGIVVKKNPGSTSEARLINNGGGGLVLQGICDIEFSGQITGNTGNGIMWTSQAPNDVLRMRLTDCDVSHNTGRGLHIEEAGLVSVVCTTRRTSFRDNGGDGIRLLLTHVDAGLQLDLQEGAASDNGGCGMNVQEGRDKENKNVLVDFQFSRNAFAGSAKIDCGVAPSRFSRVVARDNGTTGLYMEGGTWTLDHCLVADNTGAGVSMVSRTSTGGHKAVQTIKSCEFSRNGGAGFTITPDMDGGAYKVCVQDLSISKNGVNGVVLNGTCELSGRDVQLSDNTGHGLAWFAGGGGGGGLPAPSVRMSLQRLRSIDNTLSGLYVSEGGEVDVDCSFEACTFDRNHTDGATLLLPNPGSRLRFVHNGGGACDNTERGMNLVEGGSSPELFQNVVIQNNGGRGLDLVGGSWTLKDSVVKDNGSDGVVVAAHKHTKTGHVTLMKKYSVVEDNVGNGVRVYPLEAGAACVVVVENSRSSGNTGDGYHLDAGVEGSGTFRDSVVQGNGGRGLDLTGGSWTMESTAVQNNGSDGISVAAKKDFKGHVTLLKKYGSAEGNGGDGLRVCPQEDDAACRVVVQDARFSGNASNGLHVVADRPGSSITLDWLDSIASNNGDSGVVLAGAASTSKTSVSIQGGEVCDNGHNGIDLATPYSARGKIHGLHMGSNGMHGLISSSSSLTVTDNQVTGNAGSGLHIVAGAHVVARNVCTDNVTGVYLEHTGSMVLQNTFGGSSAGSWQISVADPHGPSDVAPSQNAASGTNPLGNLEL